MKVESKDVLRGFETAYHDRIQDFASFKKLILMQYLSQILVFRSRDADISPVAG